jgi:NAD(P)-dependent dehydrogenase (short-subunit alcohol dehydrogenase family)
MRYPPIPKVAVVTGCSTGIGLATAVLLKERGWRVFATARRERDLKMLRDYGLLDVDMDLSDSASVNKAAQDILGREHGKVGALVNNAGFGQPGAVEDLSREALRAQFEVNVFGLQELTRAFIPALRAQGAGRIVNISSVLGNVSLPFLGAYCASKFALEALSDSLRIELHGTGVALSVIQPGPIITAFRQNAIDQFESSVSEKESRFGDFFARELHRRRNSVKTPGFMNKSPEAVAKKVAHALESSRPWRRYCVTPSAYAGALVRRFLPYSVMDVIFRRRVTRLGRAADASPASSATG